MIKIKIESAKEFREIFKRALQIFYDLKKHKVK